MKCFLGHSFFFNCTVFLFVAVLFFVFCGKKDISPLGEEQLTKTPISIVGDNFVPDGTGRVIIPLKFTKLDNVKSLRIQKSGADMFSQEITSSNLSVQYNYPYEVLSTDPESFKLVFSVVYNNGANSGKVTVSVLNKHGFFVKNLERIARVTGNALPGEKFPSPNNSVGRWDVGGTDLGITWEMEAGKYGIFFGDTFGGDFKPKSGNPGPNGGNWRSNVLAFSDTKSLDSGIVFSSMVTGISTKAIEMIPGHQAGLPTSIPTAVIRANGVDYVHYFNTDPIIAGVKFYYSGLYKSVDNARNWSKVETVYFSPDSRFALAGFWKKDGYVYMIGTPAYRDKPAYLARFREQDIENQSAYEYWEGTSGRWVTGNENLASVLINGTVGELSFLYNHSLKKWIIVYGDMGHGFVSLRTASNITGPWSDVFKLVSPDDYPMHYGPYLHPLSASGHTLYFTLSMWEPYNVFLMKAEIVDR